MYTRIYISIEFTILVFLSYAIFILTNSQNTFYSGVPVLGTFITEWNEGEAIIDNILTSDRHLEVADQLIAIARHLRFEGWLINIEHPVRKGRLMALSIFFGMITHCKCTVNTQIVCGASVCKKGNYM